MIDKRNRACLITNIVCSQVPTYFGKVPKALLMHLVRPDEWQSGPQKLPTLVWVIDGAWLETVPFHFAPEFSWLAKAGYNVVMIGCRTSNKGAAAAR